MKSKEEILLNNKVMSYDLGNYNNAVLKAMEEYADQFRTPAPQPEGEGSDAIAFYKWMKENDTPERASEWFNYSDEDMYDAFKRPPPVPEWFNYSDEDMYDAFKRLPPAPVQDKNIIP